MKTDAMEPCQGKILVVDDDLSLRRALYVTLHGLGFSIVGASRGEEALSLVSGTEFDAVLLDVDIPGMGGLETCRSIRDVSVHLPILMLSAMDGEDDLIAGLDAGADDYITKPFRIRELTARLRSAVRRRHSKNSGNQATAIRLGDLELDPVKYRVKKLGRSIHLTPKEFEVLQFLMSHVGELIPHPRLLKSVWGPNYESEFVYLRMCVCQLRKKIEDDPLSPRYIVTVPAVGYKFNGKLNDA